jgi:hypothetical protein
MPTYKCQECDFTTKYMVQFRNHINSNHIDNDNETEQENIKLDINDNKNDNEIEKLKLQMEVLKLQLKIEMINDNKQQKKTEDQEQKLKLKKKLKPSLYLNEFIDVIPITSFKGSMFANDFLGLREIITNKHRDIVLNKSFTTCVLTILEEVRSKYGGREYFPIACVDTKRQKIFVNLENLGWVEDQLTCGYLHIIICRISQILCYFTDDNDRWKTSKDNWIQLINKCFAWDNKESESYCKKKLIASCCDLLNINEFIKQHSSSSDTD